MKYWEEWAERPPDPARLSRFTVGNNKYEQEDFQSLLAELEEFSDSRDKLRGSKAGRLAYDVAQDVYLSFWKVRPELLPEASIKPGAMVSRRVMEELVGLNEFRNLRLYTQGDEIGSALAFVNVEEDLETLYDKLDKEQELADKMEQLQQDLADAQQEQVDLDEMMASWAAENPNEGEPRDWSEDQQSIDAKIAAIMAELAELGKSLEQALNEASADMRATVRAAMSRVAGELSAMEAMADAWGTEPGQLIRLPAAERMELARRVNKNPKVQKFAELIGPLKRFAMAKQREKVNRMPEEIFDVEMGNTISRLLPTELGVLADDERELLFFKKYHDRSLLQFEMRGSDKLAKGGIILIHDGSISMSGPKEIWAKAIGLALIHISRKQKRQFLGIQFGSRGQLRVDDFRDGELNPQKVLDFAEFFFNGGTDFQSPLDLALKYLNEEHAATGALKSDIVFITDGQCGVSPVWQQHFLSEIKRLEAKVWGINIGGHVLDQPMNDLCGGNVVTIQDLTSGEPVGEMFSTI